MKQFYSFAIISALIIANTAFGQVTKTWVPTNGGNWATAANWNPSGVPTATDHVLIPANQSAAITRTSTDGETINLKGLTVSGNVNFQFNPGTANECTLNITETFTIDAIKTLTVGMDDIGRMNVTIASTATGTINGTVYMNSYSGGGYDRIFTNNGNLTIASAGLITGQNTSQFVLGSTGTLRIANAAGIAATAATGAIQIPGTRSYNAGANYVYNGSGNQNTGNGLPVLTGTLTIDNPNTVTLNNAETLGGTINLINGTFATGTNLTISATGTPLIARSGGSVTGTFQGTNDYDVTYSGNTKTAGFELVNGGLRNVTINLTAGQTLTLNANRTPDGTLSVTSGTLDISTFTINRSATGGSLNVSDGAFLKIGGTNVLPSNYTTTALNTSSTVEYYGTNQTIGNATYANLTLSGSGNKNFPGARTVNGILSVQGTAAATGTAPTFGTSSTLEYAGSSLQTSTNIEFPAASGPKNLKINNSSGVTLHAARTVTGFVTFTNGILNTTASNLLIVSSTGSVVNASDASFVDGPVKKIGAIGGTVFDFPIGKSGVGYMPIGIANVTGATTEFTAQYFRASAKTTFGTAGLAVKGLQGVSNCEYWRLDRTVTTSTANITMYWNAHSPCNGVTYVANPALGLRIAHYNESINEWDAHGGGAISGNGTAGSLTWLNVSNFSPFALAALNGSTSSLPVMYDNVKAFAKNNGVQIEWSNLTERDLTNYLVQHSVDGINFTTINQFQPKNNRNDRADYTDFHATPATGANYYRIRANEITGKIIYSKTLRVEIGGGVKQKLSLYPNPVVGNQVTVALTNIREGQYSLRLISADGRNVYNQALTCEGSSLTQSLQLPASVKPGMYTILINGDNYNESRIFIVQ